MQNVAVLNLIQPERTEGLCINDVAHTENNVHTENIAHTEDAEDNYPFTWKRIKKGDPVHLHMHSEMENMYKEIQRLHWIPEEIIYTDDQRDWKLSLNEGTRAVLTMILAFFAQADALVKDVLSHLEKFGGVLDECPYASFYITEQKAQEQVHAITYQNQIIALGLPDAEIQTIISSFKNNSTIKEIFDWITFRAEYNDSAKTKHATIADVLLVDTFTEGVLFQGAFATIQWLRTKNLLPGITLANEFITRDEGLHTTAMCEIFRYLKPKYRPPYSAAKEVCDKIVYFANSFIADGIKADMVGLSKESMNQYIRFQADYVMTQLGYEPMYRVNNPYRFMDTASLNRVIKCNFFEISGSGYGDIETGESMVMGLLTTPIEC